jgi:allantoinase
MTAYDLVLRSRRVVLPEGERPATVCIHSGRIAAVEPFDAAAGEDLGELVLLPGIVDTHVHLNEPGRTEWEGFATGTRAAAAGGVTTLIDMPLNSVPPTTSVAALDVKRRAASRQSYVDVGFWGGAVPGNEADLAPLAAAGVFGFKCFLVDSGVAEFPPLSLADLDSALGSVDALFVVHAEDPAELTAAPASHEYPDFLASRPPAAETRAIASVLDAARRTGARVHILHLSSAQALPLLSAAKREGVRVTVETCPHYLTLSAGEVPSGATQFKCCPPIRDTANQDALWQALGAGVIDCVVSDHSPCPAELKRGDFAAAWGGIASVQLGLPVVWTQAKRRGYRLTDVVRWMARRPAEVAGVPGKGRIAVGYDADLVAFAPDETFVVDPAQLHHRHPVTPYAGRRLSGVVHRTWLRGLPVTDEPHGQLLTRVAR